MKLEIVSYVTKEAAKRLFFFFPVVNDHQHKGWAGRTCGRHSIEPTTFEHPEKGTITKTWDRHHFGRSVRHAPTTNGVTMRLEWSHACQRIPNEGVVCICVFRKESQWVVRVAPHKDYKCESSKKEGAYYYTIPADTFREELRIIQESNRIIFKFGERKFFIRRDHVTAFAWAVWTSPTDTHKYDFILSWNGEKIVTVPGRPEQIPTDNLVEVIRQNRTRNSNRERR